MIAVTGETGDISKVEHRSGADRIVSACGQLAELGVVDVGFLRSDLSDGSTTYPSMSVWSDSAKITVIREMGGPADRRVFDGRNYTIPRSAAELAIAASLDNIADPGLRMTPAAIEAAIAKGVVSLAGQPQAQ